MAIDQIAAQGPTDPEDTLSSLGRPQDSGLEDPTTTTVDDSDPESSLIDALVRRGRRSREIKITREQEDFLVERILRDFNDSAGAIQSFKDRRTEWIATWRGDTTPKDFPFEGSANIRVPVVPSFVEQSKARYLAAYFGPNRPWTFNSLDPSISKEAIDEMNAWFDYELREVVNIIGAAQTIIHNIHVEGIALPVPRYEVAERMVESEHEFPVAEGIPMSDQLIEAIGQIFASCIEVEPVASGTGKFSVSYRCQAEDDIRIGEVEFAIENDQLCATVMRPEIVFDGVKIDCIELEDIVLVNSSDTIEGLPFFGSRVWISLVDFEKNVESGYFRKFNQQDFEAIAATGRDKVSDFITMPVTQSADEQEGGQSQDVQAVDYHRKWLEVYRWEGLWNPKRSGFNLQYIGSMEGPGEEIPVCVWTTTTSRRILKICRLDELTVDGSRTPIKFDFIVQPGRFFSWSLVGWLRHVATEIDMIHNQRLDSGLLTNMPFGFYTPTAGMQSTIFQLEPGKMYPMKDAKGVSLPRLNWNPAWSFQEEHNVFGYALGQAGLSPSDLGSFISKRTTASEFNETQGASDLRMQWILERMSKSFRDLFYRIFLLYQRNMRKGRVYQVTGLDGQTLVEQMDKETVAKPWRLKLTPNINQINAQLERDISVSMLSLLMNPILIQTGIVKADTIYGGMERVVKASGYTGVPLHRPDTPADSDAPDTEHKQFISGQHVTGPTINENHAEHLQRHVQFLMDPQIQAIYPPGSDVANAVGAHIKATQTMQQIVQLMRLTQAGAATQMQQSMNAMGIRPGLAGDARAGAQAAPGEPAEMDQTGGANAEPVGGET